MLVYFNFIRSMHWLLLLLLLGNELGNERLSVVDEEWDLGS